jgi:hypothetical protein
MSNFDDLGVFKNLAMPIFRWHRACRNWSPDREITTSRTWALRMVFLKVNHFPTKILAKPEMLSTNRDNQVIEKLS